MLRLKFAGLCAAFAWLCCANSAHAYDLSRQNPEDTEKVERGFVTVSGGLWLPAFGTFEEYHQLSLDFGGEIGFRFLSLRGHNLFIVGGLNVSLQKLDPDVVGDAHNNTTLLLGFGGVRYIPNFLCTPDGSGCAFAEVRIGLAFESADDLSNHTGPQGEVTVLPGVGYRFNLGGVLQLGARADFSFTAEGGSHTIGWATLAAFVGLGW